MLRSRAWRLACPLLLMLSGCTGDFLSDVLPGLTNSVIVEVYNNTDLWVAPDVRYAESDSSWSEFVTGLFGGEALAVGELRPGELWVYGEGRTAGDGPTGHCLVQERRRGPFARCFALPPDVDGMRVFAAFGNGLLTVTLPKRDARLPGRIRVPIA